ncbi:MAG TPA: response regulator [Verrucomicrobiae bacterium]|jgi:CheY-like chemotaxis protein
MKKVLLIDDDVVVIHMYSAVLKTHGFVVESATNGAAGLALLLLSRPDAVLLDLMMPKINGLGVLKSIREKAEFADLPVLVMTAAAIPAMVDLARTAGATRIFDKANDKPLKVVQALHDLLRTTSDSSLVAITKSGNPDAVFDQWAGNA